MRLNSALIIVRLSPATNFHGYPVCGNLLQVVTIFLILV